MLHLFYKTALVIYHLVLRVPVYKGSLYYSLIKLLKLISFSKEKLSFVFGFQTCIFILNTNVVKYGPWQFRGSALLASSW